MRSRWALLGAAAGVCLASGTWAQAQQARGPLPFEPLGLTDEAIFPAFEGWGPLHGEDKDGERVFLLGYYNRNRRQPLDIPVGPDNRIEPGGPDLGQPTHFEPGRQYGVFAIRIPKDLGTSKLTWTLTANGQTSVVSFWQNPQYVLNFFRHAANGNQPPVVRFSADGPALTGPPRGLAQTLAARAGEPIALRLWASDPPTIMPDLEAELSARNNVRQPAATAGGGNVAIIGGQVIGAPPGVRAASAPPADITVTWRKHRGPGAVTFAHERIPFVTGGDPTRVVEAATTATFGAPGDYVVRAQVNDSSGDGGGGLQCCWTNTHVRVTVR